MTTDQPSLSQGTVEDLFTLPNELHQKGTYAEIMTIGLVGDLLGAASQQKWVAQVRFTYRALFPCLPDRIRHLRIQLNLERCDADLALRLPHPDDDTVCVIDSKPLPICAGARYRRPRAMGEAASGRGGHAGYSEKGQFYGFKLQGVIVRFAIAPANVSDPPMARALLNEGEAIIVIGDRG